ncbi:MAG TPA: dihydrolipoamide acetyltransferase family protein [Solirubrobacteraceae bacterium]|jgi:pyruvate dehydrogenase E2 component (dihydrolipoamide acetyltransferase)|nr:dihydrolipoamide acetyltransferase family protein [Solirubrobacteraceae bacterium]
MAEIVMPRLSDTMEEGTILRWLKQDGEQVARGEELVEIETDKASMTYESDQSGVLSIVAGEGDTLPVGAVIARIGDGGGAAQSSTGAGESDEGPALEGPAGGVRAAGTAADAGPDADAPNGGGPAGDGPPDGGARGGGPSGGGAQEGDPPGGEARAEPGERVKASPLARRMASEGGVDLRMLTGSGPGGRIVKADVLGAQAGAGGTPAGATPSGTQAGRAPGGTPAGTARGGALAAGAGGAQAPTLEEAVRTAKGQTREVELSRLQQTVARRMAESKATIPDFTLQLDVDMEACVALRTQLKELSRPADAEARRAHEVPTYNDMVVKAAALALREHANANGSYRDGRVQLHSRVNVGVAVAAESALVVPTVFDADEKSLGEIAREARGLAERVRAGTITPPELGGGTFTVSNLGMYGIRSFTAIINPPQAGILSVGALAPRAVVREGEVVARHVMTLTLACDHRILYGAEAALFLARVGQLLEAPSSLTL